ncbi:50S ribosome-binding protein YggL [Anaerovorax sp. IOR16]|uniref:50S ribosome-binding protein YggL n=1 Tax=Anaerovorax sp. IOR16 TaxID=2773458 RepID=UPI0019D17027|nr:50S ribosome-binding protein YggL [Anaerovorax sp. IOR16]
MRKEFEFQGCVEVPAELSEDEFMDKFIEFIEVNGWSFGGGINTIIDGFYINPDGTKGKYVLDE